MEQNYIYCAICGCIIEDGCETEHDGKTYCETCFDGHFITCEKCGEVFPADDITAVNNDTLLVCPECLEDYCYQCDDCGEWFTDGYMYAYDGNMNICENCSDDYFICEDCGDVFHADDAISVNNGEMYVCGDCAESNYYRCEDCGEYFTSRYMFTYDNNIDLCEDCGENYYICEECGDAVHCDDVVWVHGDPYCEHCAPNSPYIEEYSYEPCWHKCVTYDDYPNARTYGVELEIDGGYDIQSCAEDLHHCTDDIIMKEDGSLSNDGIEIVTHPATLAYHTEEMGWEDIASIAKEYGYKSHDTRTCGLHVHIGRDELKEDTPDKLVVLVDSLWEELTVFSRRDIDRLNHWAAKPCVGVTPTDTPEVRKEKIKKVKDRSRYQAVNLHNYATVEIRIFRGTLNTNTIYATLQLVDTLCEYCETHTFEECATAEWADVISLCDAPELATYLKERGLN